MAMIPCVVLLAIAATVVAVIALVIATNARSEVRALRQAQLQQHPIQPTPAPPPAEVPIVAPAAVAPPPPTPPPPPAPQVQEPIAPPPPPPQWKPATASAKTWSIDWENLVGIKLFSWIAGIALVLAAVFLFKYSIDHGWLRPAVRAVIGVLTGVGLLVVCELRIARNYRFTANAMDGAGIAILYATLFALHGRWRLWPASAAFLGMLVVTAIAVILSTRRGSIFIALLGLLGGFATPALLSSGENRPIALFSYLLLLNGGISWIAYRKRWPLLTALSLGLTAFYQWGWVSKFLTSGQLPLAAAIFLLFAIVAAVSFWPSGADNRAATFRRIAAAGAVLPLLFAFFTAIVPEYGARYNVLFGFLLLVTTGLAAIAIWRGPAWLHSLGGAATLLTFFIWLVVSYTNASWPLLLLWLAAFIALYLVVALRLDSIAVYASALLFFVLVALANYERFRFMTLTGAMFALLAVVVVYALQRRMPNLAAMALALSSVMLTQLDLAPAWLIIAAQSLVFAALFTIAWISERHSFAVIAVPFFVAALVAAERLTDSEQLLFGSILYALFLAYPLSLGSRVKQARAPHLAAVLASVVFFVHAYEMRSDLGYEEMIGFLPIVQALLLIVLLWRLLSLDPQPGRLALVAGAVLAFLTAAIPLQLEDEWMTIAFALEAAALTWLYRRIPHRGLLLWSGGLTIVVFIRLVLNPNVYEYHSKSATPILNWYLYAYLICAAAMFVIAWLAPHEKPALRRIAATAGTVELFVLLNIEIADFYSKGDVLTFNFMGSSLAQDLTYTMGWAVFAMGMLVAGIALHERVVRISALGLLLITILKCFLHDLARLGGLYRVGSLFGLAVSLVLVGLMLQKFVMMKRETTPTP